MEVTPSILTDDIDDFWRQIKRLLPYYQHFQIDIADEEFVPGKTVSTEKILKSAKRIKSDIPLYRLLFDFHLMVMDFEDDIDTIQKIKKLIGVDVIFLHVKRQPNYEQLQDTIPLNFGLVLDPDDSVRRFIKRYNLDFVTAIQIMSVYPGEQGQLFIPDSLEKIEQLRDVGYGNKIYLDGGINEKALPVILSQKYQPDVIGPGSYFSKAKDIEEKVNLLNQILSQNHTGAV